MIYKPGDIASFDIQTYNQSSALANPSALSVAVFRNDVLDATITPTVAVLETGVREVTFTIPISYAKGDRVRASVDATCDSRRAVKTMFRATLDSKRVGDLHDATQPNLSTVAQESTLADARDLIRDDIAALDTGSGDGANIVTIGVKHNGTPLQNARVRVSEGINLPPTTTNADGVVTFSLDDATYALSITKDGYKFEPATIVVDADHTEFEVEMELIVWPASEDPDKVNVRVAVPEFSELQIPAVEGMQVNFNLTVPKGTTWNGRFVVPVTVGETTDADGVVVKGLPATPPGCEWVASLEAGDETIELRKFTLTGNEGQLNLADYGQNP